MSRMPLARPIRLTMMALIAAGLVAGPASPPVLAMATGQPTKPAPKPKDQGAEDKKKKSKTGGQSQRQPVPEAAGLPGYREAKLLIDKGDYSAAIARLDALSRPEDANVLNLLGFAHRKLGLIEVGIGYYLKALARNPGHKEAHEYLGEAYLQKDEVAKAKALLGKLRELCGGTGCEEYRELSEAIEAYDRQHSL